MKSHPLVTLRKVRKLLNDPAKHTTGVSARSATQTGVSSTDPTAVCWCLMGACWKFGGKDEYTALGELALDELRKQLQLDNPALASLPFNEISVADFNDKAPHSEILVLLDHTISRLEQ